MLAKSRGFITYAFCSLLFAGAGWAQISAIEGEVKGTDGKLLKDAQILIEREDMKGVYKGAKTDKKGHYIYNGLPLGTYTVSVLVEGEKKDFIQHLRTQMGDPVVASFDLEKTPEAKPVFTEGLGKRHAFPGAGTRADQGTERAA